MSPHRFNRYFRRSEFACKCGCGFDTVDNLTFVHLMAARVFYESPLIILSGCRCIVYNEYVGGAVDSQHLYARATDHYVVGISPKELYDFYEERFEGRFGLGLYNWGVHMDTKTAEGRRWSYMT